jgi:hypothetical protein
MRWLLLIYYINYNPLYSHWKPLCSLETMSLFDILGAVANVKALMGLGATIGVISASGAVPKVGIFRALSLGWRNVFRTISPISVRQREINLVISDVENLTHGGYVVVTGGKGHGKSCLIDTALNHRKGVIKISVSDVRLISFLLSNHFLFCYRYF